MNDIDRAANVLQARLSWPAAEGCARDLAAAGLLVTEEVLRHAFNAGYALGDARAEAGWDRQTAQRFRREHLAGYLAARGAS